MSPWLERILKEFPADVAKFWIAADPDGVLLDEQVLEGLRARGFELVRFEDSVAFRADFEERYRSAWDRGEQGPARALILHLLGTNVDELPWDYLRSARRADVSLGQLFAKLNYPVMRQLGSAMLPALFEAQAQYAEQPLGEGPTKEFILTHIFRLSPHLIARPEDLWSELLRLHYRESAVPPVLAEYIAQVLRRRAAFSTLPIAELFSDRTFALRVVQDAWYRFLHGLGVDGTRMAEPPFPESPAAINIPFEHPDVRSLVDSMFLDGTLHPLAVDGVPQSLPFWAGVGVVKDATSMRNLVHKGITALQAEVPGLESSYRDWISFARRMAEIQSRTHSLDAARAESLKDDWLELRRNADAHIHAWVAKHYADLPSLPVARQPVMVHHVPRFLALRLRAGEAKIALLVFDGLALDQWSHVRECVMYRSRRYVFDESACFAWLPTLTSVSRQALFSGLRPREFQDSIESTAREPGLWARFWQDEGLRTNEIVYRRSITRMEDLAALRESLSQPSTRVAGVVVDTVDQFIHGAILGKRGIAKQIDDWCESGFVDRLFEMLMDMGFHVYVTADHGNVEAVGVGRPKEGVAAELRGERVRVYRSDALRSETLASFPGTCTLEIAGLPTDYLPVFAGGQGAFVSLGEQAVAHGGASVEEILVPFVKVSSVN